MKTKRKSKSIALFSMLAMILVGAGVTLTPSKAVKTEASALETYQEVTENQADWSGEYLIVSKADNLAFDGSRTTPDAEGNIVSVTITAGKISLDSKYSFEIIKNGTNYDLKTASGKFIYGKSNDANGMDSATTANTIKNAISYDSSGVAIIKSTGTASNYLVYNSANPNGTRFRYYKSGSSGAGKGSGTLHAVSLFKKVVGEVPITESFELDTDTLSLDIAESYQLETIFTPLAASPSVSYSITSQSNPAGVVSVSASGLVFGLRQGTATIEAVTNDGSDLDATVSVTVSGNYASSVLTPTQAHLLAVGDDVTVRGKVVTEVQDNGSYAIQVGNRGIMTYTIGTLTVGNDVVIVGKMGAYSGMPQVTTPTTVIDLGPSTTVVTPQTITAVSEFTPALSGTLVQIDGMKYASGTFSTSAASTVNLTLGGTAIQIRATASVDNSAINAANATFGGTGPDDALNVTTTAGWFNGAQLLFTADTVIQKIVPVFGTLDRIELTTTNVKTSYYVGELFTLTNLVVTAYDQTGLAKIVTDDATSSLASGYKFVAGDIGTKTITIEYAHEGGVPKSKTFDVTVEAVPAWTKVTMSYSGATTNMAAGNNASLVGLDPSIFNVVSTEREIAPMHVGLNTNGQIRLYGSNNAAGNGNVLTVSISEAYVITSFKFAFGGTIAPALIKGGSDTLHDGNLTKDTSLEFADRIDTEFSIKNIVKNATTQIYILSVEIIYESAAGSDPVYDEAKVFADWMMDQTGGDIVTAECASKYGTAKTKWAALSSDAQAEFKTHGDFLNARNRLERWAIANGETLEQFYSGVSGGQQREFLDNKTTLSIVVVLSILGITTIAGFYFLKRKEKVNIE